MGFRGRIGRALSRASLLAALIVAVVGLSAVTPSGSALALDVEEQAFLGIINDYRAANALAPLSANSQLNDIARWMSQDMVANDYFGHTDSLGRAPSQRSDDLGSTYNPRTGANRAAGVHDDPARLVRGRGGPIGAGRMCGSNAYRGAAVVREAGGVPKGLGIASDTVEALTAKLHEALDADLVITSAGVSRGDYDVVKDVLAKEGEIDFWTVRMKPGKPLAFGTFETGSRRVPHIGLPGNPVSPMITFELFGRAAIYKMLGKSGWQRQQVRAIAEDRIVNTDGRRIYARAILTERDGQYHASLTGPQGSGILTSMALANALAVVPEDVAVIEPGDEVTCLLLG